MLPGIRLLLAAVVLSVSIVVFGLGAAALLRAAHEDFASNPSWHVTPDTRFAQQNEMPTLALLRVDVPAPPVAEKPAEVPTGVAPEASSTVPTPAVAPSEQMAAVSPVPEPDRTIAPAVASAIPSTDAARKDEVTTEAPPSSAPPSSE